MSRTIGILLLACMLGVSTEHWAGALAAVTQGSSQKAFALAGLVMAHGHRIQSTEGTVNVRVVSEVISEEHAGKAYDVIFLVLPSSLEEGHIVTLTSGSTESCRASLKSLLRDHLTPKVIDQAYKGARLTRVEDNKAVRELATQWRTRGWLRNCAESAGGEHDIFEVLILNDVGN
jgi:hypothetical protein